VTPLSYEIPRESNFQRNFVESWLEDVREHLNPHDLSQGLGIFLLIAAVWISADYSRLVSSIGLFCLAFSLLRPDQRKLREVALRAGESVRLSQFPASGVWTMDYNESTPYAPMPVQWARLILAWALKDHADMVRISIGAHTMQVEYRIDGSWSDPTRISGEYGLAIQSHLRRMAGLEGKDSNEGVIKLVMEGWFSTFNYQEEFDGTETRLILTRLAPPQGSPQ
jgi:hypothetical protein